MAILIWEGSVSTDVNDGANWLVQSTGVPHTATPSYSDTLYIGETTTGNALTGTTLYCEGFYVFGSTASYFMPNPGPAFDGVKTAMTFDVDIVDCAGVVAIGCGTEGTTLQLEGVGFTSTTLFTTKSSGTTFIGTSLNINGGNFVGASVFQYDNHLWLGDGASGFDPVMTSTTIKNTGASNVKLQITKDALRCSAFELHNSSGSSKTIDFDMAVLPNQGARKTDFLEFLVDKFTTTGPDPMDLSWTGGSPILLTDLHITLDGSLGPHTIPTAALSPTMGWRFKLLGPWNAAALYATESATAAEQGMFRLSGTQLTNVASFSGWGDVTTENGALISTVGSVTWESGATIFDATLLNQTNSVTFKVNGGNQGLAQMTCDESQSLVYKTTGTVEFDNTLGSYGASTLNAYSTTSSSFGSLHLKFGGTTDIAQTCHAHDTVEFKNGSTTTQAGIGPTGVGVNVTGNLSATPGPVISRGEWSSVRTVINPWDTMTAYVSYHGESGSATGLAGTYRLVGDAVGGNTFNLNNRVGGSPVLVMKALELYAPNMDIAFLQSNGEMEISDTFSVDSSMSTNTKTLDFSKLDTLWMDGDTTFTISAAPGGWPIDGIPFVRWKTGTHTFSAPDSTIDLATTPGIAVKYGYVEGASTFNYTAGRFRQLSIVDTTTIVAAQAVRLQPSNSMVAWSSGTNTTLNAVPIDVDLRDIGPSGNVKCESYSTASHGTIQTAFRDVEGSTLQIENMDVVSVHMLDVTAGAAIATYIEFLGSNICLTQPKSIDFGYAQVWHIKCTGDLLVKESVDYTTNRLAALHLNGGTLTCRNAANTAYTDFELGSSATVYLTGTLPPISMACLSFRGGSSTIDMISPTGHENTVIEVYKSHSNPTTSPDAAVWLQGTNINSETGWGTTKSINVAFETKAANNAEYALIHQECAAYTGIGVKGDSTKLTLDGVAHNLTGPFWHSSTETTFSGLLVHKGAGPCALYDTRGTIGASSVLPRLESRTFQAGAYTGNSDIANCHPHYIKATSAGTGTLVHTTVQDTTYTVEDDGIGWGIETGTNWTATQAFHQGMDLKVVDGDIKYLGTGTIEAEGDPTLYLLGVKSGSPTYLDIEVTSLWNITGTPAPLYTAVQIGDATYNTTVANYKWANLGVAPADSYPSHLSIQAGCSCRPAIATTGAGYVTGSGTFDWNPNIAVGNDQVFEISRSDNNVAFADSLSMTNGHYLMPTFRSIMRFTPNADPTSGACVLPDILTCDVDIGLQTAGTYTVQADYHVKESGATINGRLSVDWADTSHGVKGANVLKGTGAGSSGMLTVNGVNANDYLKVFGNGRILSDCYLTVIEADFIVNTGGIVESDKVLIDHRTTTTYKSFAFTPTGTVSGTDLHFLGKDKTTTTVTNNSGAVTYTNIYVGITGAAGTNANLTLVDVGSPGSRDGTVFNITALHTGDDSVINFENGHSYWKWSASGTINDGSTTPSTPGAGMVADVYGTPSLGLIVVDGAYTLTHTLTATNQGVIADMLFLNNGATFTTSGASHRRTLWLQGRACADLYTAATTNQDVGIGCSIPVSQPALHIHDSDFHFPSNGGDQGTSDTLVIGSTAAGDSAGNAAIYGKCEFTVSSGNLSLLNTYCYNHGKGGFWIGIDNAQGGGTTALFSNTRFVQDNNSDIDNLWRLDNYNGTGNTSNVLIENNHISTANDGATGIFKVGQIDYFVSKFNNNECIGNFTSALQGAITVSGTPTLSELQENRIECTGTTAKIVALDSLIWPTSDTYFKHNNVVGMNLSALNICVDLPTTTLFNVKRNFIACNNLGTPVDVSGPTDTADLYGWSLPISNTNIGKSCQNTTYPLISEWTNCTNLSEMVIAGITPAHRVATVFDPGLWLVDSGTAPTISKTSGRKTFRKSQDTTTILHSINNAPGSNLVTLSWDDWDSADAITVSVRRNTVGGSTTVSVTNGGTFDASSCISWNIIVGFPSTEAGFANMIATENVSGLVLFSDCQPTKDGNQDSTADLILTGVGLGPGTGTGGAPAATGNAVQSHYYNDPVNQVIYGQLDGSDANVATGTSRYVTAICAQDEDNRYEYRVDLSAGVWTQSIVKIVGGAETVLVGPTTITPTVSGTIIFQGTYDANTNEIGGSFSDAAAMTFTDSTFTNGYFGLSGYGNNTTYTQFNEQYVFEGAPDGTQLIIRYAKLTFMPNSHYQLGAGTTDVDLSHLIVNSNQSTVFPNLHNGTWNPILEDVSWADGRMDEDIISFVQLNGVKFEVDQDITLSGDGKLWLTGCNVSGKNGIRWQIRTEGVSYTSNVPPLKIEGCLLSGLQYTIRPVGNNPYEPILLDDPSHSTSVIRMQSDKDIDVERHRVVGLGYDRMTDGGFESRLSTVTCVCVDDAYVMGMCEKLWMERTLIEFISPYCYTYRAKITQYNQRILNPQITASQFVIEIEEWRND